MHDPSTIVLRTKEGMRTTLSRVDGDALQFVLRGNYRARNLGLAQVATGTTLTLPFTGLR